MHIFKLNFGNRIFSFTLRKPRIKTKAEKFEKAKGK